VVLPELAASRCVHAALPNASCRACANACPRDAWILGEAALRFDAQSCDGCGLCVPACPQQAIRLPLLFEQRPLAGETALLARCDFSGDGEDDKESTGRIPCLHSISLHDLLRAWRKNQRIWLVRRGDCARCHRGHGEQLAAHIAGLNSGLAARRLSPIMLREVSSAAWTNLANAPAAQTAESRRGFFSALGKRPVAALLKGELGAADEEMLAPGEFLPAQPGAILPWHIHLDASRCIACHACARVCPQHAIQQVEGETPAYRLQHRSCTGCGLCSDVCEHGSVSPRSWGEPHTDEVLLQERRCEACGVHFQMPAVSERSSLCWVCARAHPVRRKRQVMA